MVIPGPERQEDPAPVGVFGISLWCQRRKSVFQNCGHALGNREALAGVLKDCRAHDAFARAEPVQRPAQLRCGGIPVEQWLQRIGQALRRKTGALIQLLMQRLLLVLFLIIRKQSRDQRYARDHWKHQPQTKSHTIFSPHAGWENVSLARGPRRVAFDRSKIMRLRRNSGCF